ncbi:MAG: hypothetical protein H7X93_11525 [Sphingomonadaceae bacterium]|nr:hypothetical protein [Sphingomonadaceae bacterium]
MRNTVFWIVGIVALLWNGFGLYNFYLTMVRDPVAMAQASPEMIALIDAAPEWRMILWGACVFLGVLAAIALLLRRAIAERIFWATVVGILIGLIGWDLTMGNGIKAYGPGGLAFQGFIVAAQAGFALYARWAARQGMLR